MSPNEQYTVKQSQNSGGIGNWLRTSLGSLWNKLTGAGMTEAQQQQQDYQTEMSNTAFQRQVSDMQKAGLNPALMYGNGAGNGASTPSGPEVSGNGDIAGAVQLALLSKQAKLMDAQAEKATAEAGLTSRETAWKDKLSQATLDEVASRIGLNEAEIDAKQYDNALKKAQEIFTRTQNGWYGRMVQSQINANDAAGARNRAEAAIAQMEFELGHRLSSSELLAITDSILSLIAGRNPLTTPAGKAITRVFTSKGKRTATADELAGKGGRAASYPGRRSFGQVPGQRRTRYGSSNGAGGR